MRSLLTTICLLAAHALFAQAHHTDKASTGQLPDSVHRALRAHLARYHDGPLRDTVFLKFDFNREHCWDRLDEQGDDHNRSFVANKQQRFARLRAARSGASIIELREPGRRFNKLKAWDSSIHVDSGFVRDLLFRKRATCGTSALLLPSGRYILLRSDPHFAILYWDRPVIEGILARQ